MTKDESKRLQDMTDEDIDPAHHQWASQAVGGAALLAYPLFCPLFFCLLLFYPLPFLRRA